MINLHTSKNHPPNRWLHRPFKHILPGVIGACYIITNKQNGRRWRGFWRQWTKDSPRWRPAWQKKPRSRARKRKTRQYLGLSGANGLSTVLFVDALSKPARFWRHTGNRITWATVQRYKGNWKAAQLKGAALTKAIKPWRSMYRTNTTA